jgi:hypothetical protein
MSSLAPAPSKFRELMRDNCQKLIDAVSQTTEEGNSQLSGLFFSDPIEQSSPIRLLPALPITSSESMFSSPLSSPPKATDRVAEHRFLLEDGNRELIRWQPQAIRQELALAYIRSGQMKKNESLRSVALDYGVPRETIRKHINGGLSHKEAANEKLLPGEVLTLIGYIEYLYNLGIPATMTRVLEMFNELLQRRYANEIGVSVRSLDGQVLPVNYTAKDHTVRRFVERHNEIQFMLSRTLESKRARQTNRDIAVDFLTKLRTTLRRYNILPQDIWNMDETGYATGAFTTSTTKVIVPATVKSSARTGADSREWVSVIESVSAASQAAKPYFIFKGKIILNRHLKQLDTAFPDGWSYGVSQNGWTDDFHAVQWLVWWEEMTRPFTYDPDYICSRQLTDGQIKRVRNGDLQWEDNIKPSNYRLLILDGHGSHLTGAFIAYAVEHNIILLCLPPHTSHYLQPLDVGIFTGMKRKYRRQV